MTNKIDIETLSAEEIKQHINLETGKLDWQELSRHFARDVVVVVDPQLDLTDVAAKMIIDDKDAVEIWLNADQLVRADDRHAQTWQKSDTLFWSVVVAPWVLVQEISMQ